jgi:hypothetical protein
MMSGDTLISRKGGEHEHFDQIDPTHSAEWMREVEVHPKGLFQKEIGCHD